ncbi:hypothetical protein C3L33_00281, partial [Rhododendron williamsianum]
MVSDASLDTIVIMCKSEEMPKLEVHRFFFPVFQWGPDYSLKLLKSDVFSGLTIASLAIPQMSDLNLALAPFVSGKTLLRKIILSWGGGRVTVETVVVVVGNFVPPLIYSALGSSRHLVVGPGSVASLVLATMLGGYVSPSDQPILYLQLAFTATFFAGVFQTSLGLLRLGFVINFLSKATLVGFMAGSAVIVSLQQLKGLLGIVHFSNRMQMVPVLSSVFTHRNEEEAGAFLVSAAAPLTSVIFSTLIVYLFRSNVHGIPTVRYDCFATPRGRNRCGKDICCSKKLSVDGNKEMMAIGLMNMAGSCSSCYITTGSFSRSAVNYIAGAKTVISNVIMSLTVLVTLLFLMPLLAYTPNFIFAVIIISAVVGLIDYQARFGCLAIAVGVSVFKILLHVTRPNTVVLGNIPGTQIYQSLSRYREASRVPSFLIIAVESPFWFANSTYLQRG